MWYNITRSCAHALLVLGRRQVVRHQVLVLAFGGSSPSGPAKLCINRLARSGWAVFFCLLRLLFYDMITGSIIKVLHVDEGINRKEKDGN